MAELRSRPEIDKSSVPLGVTCPGALRGPVDSAVLTSLATVAGPADHPREGATRSQREATRLHERLTKVQAEYKRVSAEQGELEQQVLFLGQVADDAETRRLVAETPLADREWQAARTDLERHRKLLEESRTKAEQLAAQRDELLDRLLEEPT